MKLILLASLAVLASGCASAVRVPVKVAAIPVKVGVNTVREAILLPVHVTEDTIGTKKQAAPAQPKAIPDAKPKPAEPKQGPKATAKKDDKSDKNKGDKGDKKD